MEKFIRTFCAGLDILCGKPSPGVLPLAYWKSGVEPENAQLNPGMDGCGLIWFSPLISMRGKDTVRYIRLVEEICASFEVEPLITLTTLTDRCFESTVPLLFNLQKPAEIKKLHACYAALLDACTREGFIPYRLPLFALSNLFDRCPAFSGVIRAFKNSLDPHDLIAPGRYEMKPPETSNDCGIS